MVPIPAEGVLEDERENTAVLIALSRPRRGNFFSLGGN
jgi:hypothetical protein